MIVLAIAVLYLLLGFLLFLWGDADEMSKHVPYGNVPAIQPLRDIRILAATIITIIGPVLLTYAIVTIVGKDIVRHVKRRLLVRRVDKIVARHPEIADTWKVVRTSYLRKGKSA